MANERSEIRWTPRVLQFKIRRLYEADAQGLPDQELLDDVGITLLQRCRDILTIRDARQGRVPCPRCARQQVQTIIERGPRVGDPRDEVLVCSRCGWQLTWGEYALSFKGKQLHHGGATDAFEAYVREYPAARTATDKMLTIDRLIHAFHYSLRSQPDLPCRPAGINLIEGKATDVVEFLDNLTYGEQTPERIKQEHAAWRAQLARTYWGRRAGAGEPADDDPAADE